VKTGHREERVVERGLGGHMMEILDVAAAERGCRVGS
jgi:hypothetical protein